MKNRSLVKVHKDVQRSKTLGYNSYNILEDGVKVKETSELFLSNCVTEFNTNTQFITRMTRFKAPHAYISGLLTYNTQIKFEGVRVSYNPFDKKYFYRCDTGEEVKKFRLAKFTKEGVFVIL